MNYYQHHIGDFNSATRHLTRTERSIYRDLIELYYDTERAISLDLAMVCRKICANDEREVVQAMLDEFFVETADGWVNERCERELEAYRSKSGKAKESAAKRWQSERNANAMPTHSERIADAMLTNNQEPITNNQEPITKAKPKNTASYDAIPDLVAAGVDPQKAVDWLAVRKAKRAAQTKTAIEGVLRNIAAYGISADQGIQICCERGWVGFDGAWLNARASPTGKPDVKTGNAQILQRWIEKTAEESA